MQLRIAACSEKIDSSGIGVVMSSTKPPVQFKPGKTGGHLTLRPEGEGADVRALFGDSNQRMGRALWVSIGTHAAAILLVILVVRMLPEEVYESVLPDTLSEDLIWLMEPGPGGGGGGGGDPKPEPPRRAEAPGEDKITVPVAPKPEPTPEPVPEQEPPPIQQITIPAQQMAAATTTAPGVLDPGASSVGGAGSGPGTGAGQGQGSGLGVGTGGGTGGGAYRPGSGVSLPRVLREVKPRYTAEAMRAKVQGTVLLECIVQPDGTVGPVRIVRSLDSTFGLDEEAIKAAKDWRFSPGIHAQTGQPVPVIITIELTFTLR